VQQLEEKIVANSYDKISSFKVHSDCSSDSLLKDLLGRGKFGISVNGSKYDVYPDYMQLL